MSGAPDQIRSIVERILRLKGDQDAISDDIKEIYAEAKANGFDKTALGTVVGIKRKQAKDAEKFAEQDATVRLYLDALDGPRTHTHEPAREASPAKSISARAKARTSEAMADQKTMVREMAELGLISPEAAAENVRLADAVAAKFGAGPVEIDPETGEVTEAKSAFSGISIPDDQLVSVRYPDGVRKVPYAEFKRGVAAAQSGKAA